ncbi:MarR family winged helix-turn-helix transcriptional regulator [Streptomyces odonnellii]|uniref:MarR family winged helix-turn-helix transcriptional regulator n=1 Tax=Streptomyces odonnellii TaxID=1417980 RepID=UPI0007C73632|nr:MarR family transcriptional regulator [Streptomyces odonnellii]
MVANAAGGASAEGDDAGVCPSDEQVALLRQWDSLQSGLRRLSEQVLKDVHHSTGLAPSSFQVLWFLLLAPGQAAPMSELSRTLGFTTAGTTKVADRLCEAGLMERRPHPTDRRVTRAALTPQGRTTATKAALTLADALQERVITAMGLDGLQTLADFATRVDPEVAPSPARSAIAQSA